MSEQHAAPPSLSPQARALLAQLNGAQGASADAALTEVRPEKPSHKPDDDVPVFLAPHADPKAKAFAELLGHIDDAANEVLVDEQAALKAAEAYRSEKQAAHIDFDDADTMADMEAEQLPPSPQSNPEQAQEQQSADMDDGAASEEAAEADGERDAELDALLGDDLFDDDGFDDFDDMDDQPTGFQGFLARLRGTTAGVKKLIGVKDAASAYDAQSGASLLPFTIIRTVILVLVAAVPPAVNLIVIQPQISDNSRKLIQIRGFEAKAVESKKAADKLALKLGALEQEARRRIDALMPNEQLENLFNRYTSALQQYDVGLQGYNVSSLEERNVIIGDRVQQASLVELQLEGRYDVYVDIRKIFVEQLKNVVVLNETLEPKEDGVTLAINARMMVPTKRAYDSELDDPEKIKQRKEAAAKADEAKKEAAK